jgi:tRNA threonylcarbamoyl adenosine modification protein YjeE
MRAVMTDTVPGTSSAGRARLRPCAGHVGHFAVESVGQPLQSALPRRSTGPRPRRRFGRIRARGPIPRWQPPAKDRRSEHPAKSPADCRNTPRPEARHADLGSEADTDAFARRLAQHPQLARAFIALHGDLGAGKTTFVRHLLRALGVAGRIKSPTYAVVEPHETAAFPAWHFDFYRFNDPREWEDAGFRDIFDGPGLKLAEWPEKAAGLLPPADLTCTSTCRPTAAA